MDGDLAAELYASGLTISQLGERLGVSPSTARKRLTLAGVQIRKGSTRRPAGWSQYQRTSRSAARTFHQWHEILADALSRREAVSVRATVAEYLRRTPTKSESPQPDAPPTAWSRGDRQASYTSHAPNPIPDLAASI